MSCRRDDPHPAISSYRRQGCSMGHYRKGSTPVLAIANYCFCLLICGGSSRGRYGGSGLLFLTHQRSFLARLVYGTVSNRRLAVALDDRRCAHRLDISVDGCLKQGWSCCCPHKLLRQIGRGARREPLKPRRRVRGGRAAHPHATVHLANGICHGGHGRADPGFASMSNRSRATRGTRSFRPKRSTGSSPRRAAS
jgi:hypothetical protein